MTSAGELIDRATPFARDVGGGFQTEELHLLWINEAQSDLAARTTLLEQEETSTTDGTNSLSLPTDPDLVEIQEVLLGTDDRVVFVGSQEWNTNSDAGSTPPNTLCRIFDDHMEFYPTPDDATAVTIRFKRLPNPIDSADDEIELPAQLHRKLVEYMKAQQRFLDGDFGAGNNWMGLYEQGLAPVSTGRERFQTRPLAVSRKPNAWDLQPGTTHV